MKYTGAQWQEPSPVIIPDGILDLVDGDHLTASALVRRGIHSVEIARGYLNPNDYSPASPSDLPDFDQAGPGQVLGNLGQKLGRNLGPLGNVIPAGQHPPALHGQVNDAANRIFGSPC